MMKIVSALLLSAALVAAQNHPKRLLAIGAVSGYQHDSTSDALATLWKIGKETGLWDTYIRTDTQLITKKKLENNAKNLDYFDAIVFYTTGELPLDDEQKSALLSFVRDDGKGFIGIHSALDTLYKWPEYGDLIGAWFDQHPWGVFDAPMIVEDSNFPAMRGFPARFTIHDEIYQPSKEFSRDKVRVLMRMDETKLDLTNPLVHRKDKDFAVVWVRNYGKGRMFYSNIGHERADWKRPDIQSMYREAVKWAMGLIPGDATPRPRP